MPSSKPPPTPASAPDLIGPTTVLGRGVSGPRSARRSRDRPYSHAHFEVDLTSTVVSKGTGHAIIGKLEGWLGERKVEETTDVLRLTTATLHAFSGRGYRWVEDWKASPGGKLPLPGTDTRTSRKDQPVGELLRALESGAWGTVAGAREFEIRLTNLAGNRVQATMRQVHREHDHPISLDLRGKWTKQTIHELTGSLNSRLPVARITLTKFQYAG